MKKSAYMTREDARKIRAKQLEGKPVSPLDAYRAIWTLSKRKDKLHIPKLSREAKEMANAILLFNLGKALRAPQPI